MSGKYSRIGLVAALAAAVAAYFVFDLGSHLTLDNLKARQSELVALVEQRPLEIIGGFFLLYVAVTALSLPGAAIMTIAAGAIFGFWRGTLIVSFASAIGASLAFLSSRYLLRDWVKSRFGRRVGAIDRGIGKDGAFYLLTLRLIPAFPFFLINLAMGLTAMRLIPFYLVSQIGMLPGTMVFVNAGVQLRQIRSTGDILSPELIGSFVLLGIFPLIAKLVLGWWKRRRIYRGFRRPARFDRNLVVIGAGAGGLVTSYIAATVRAKVTLIEGGRMGGDCLNTGCVPSKALIRSARLAHEMRTAADYGLAPAQNQRSTSARDGTRERDHPADRAGRQRRALYRARRGRAQGPCAARRPMDRRDRRRRADHRALDRDRRRRRAAGARYPGAARGGYLTSDTMWEALSARSAVPERVAVLGGGPIGTEMAQAFARLGAAVTQVERARASFRTTTKRCRLCSRPRCVPKGSTSAPDMRRFVAKARS